MRSIPHTAFGAKAQSIRASFLFPVAVSCAVYDPEYASAVLGRNLVFPKLFAQDFARLTLPAAIVKLLSALLQALEVI